MKNFLKAFPPILPDNPHTLILGTMPGRKSLEAGQYYAHPQNQFWKLMGDIYGADPSLPYEKRVEILKTKGVAVWDVVKVCSREGSMDAAIKNEIINDFEKLFRQHSTIKLVVFNSATAEKLYKKHAQPARYQEIKYRRVPSPSPAHARLPYSKKLALWVECLVTEN